MIKTIEDSSAYIKGNDSKTVPIEIVVNSEGGMDYFSTKEVRDWTIRGVKEGWINLQYTPAVIPQDRLARLIDHVTVVDGKKALVKTSWLPHWLRFKGKEKVKEIEQGMDLMTKDILDTCYKVTPDKVDTLVDMIRRDVHFRTVCEYLSKVGS